ncbi:outer membrane protein assembly factor BamA [Breoghania sp.]|uniref:outer membrane protein assembly factor BamA n=1 Tax=Breoghania sp. TaxID=2065378 RepID=UPI0029C87492|nr:outer membrane protein assembly factor BamA [Breoghania sp.]
MDRKPGKIRISWWWAVFAAILLYALPAPAAQDALASVHSQDTAGAGMVVAGIQVIVKAPPDRIGDNEALARQLIAIKTGNSLTQDAIQTSIDALRLSNRFAAIDVDSRTTPAGEVLVYTLTPHQYIEDIRIHGNEPIFEAEILNQMTLYPGDPYTKPDLSEQEKAVVKRYKRAGYINPKVSVAALPHDEGENAVIVVDITKGPHYRLGRLTFEGRRGLSETMLKLHMRIWRTALWPAGRFSEYWLKKDMDSLLAYYRRKGFADAALSYRTALAEDGRHVDVMVRIDEGPRYKVSFAGHHRFWKFTLQKDVAIYSIGNRGNKGARKTVSNIKQRYHEDGFLEARVEVEQNPAPDAPLPTTLLQFVIHEGPQTKVESVHIGGNHFIEEKKIEKQMLTRPPSLLHDGAYVPETLEEDVFAVRTLYIREGFQEEDVNAEADLNADKTRAKVNVEINEGPRTRVEAITLEGLTVEGLSEEKIKTRLAHKVGGPFRQSALEADKQTIASLVSEKGRPYVTVAAKAAFNADKSQAAVEYTVDPGPLVTLGGIFISGNLKTKERIIRRELAHEPGAPLSLQALNDGQRSLRDLSVFHDVNYRTIGLKEKAETVTQIVEIEEAEPYYAELSVGYESDSGFYGKTKVGDRNLFGLAKDLWAGGEVSETGFKVETRLTEPRLFGTHITATLGAYHEELTEFNQPFGTRTSGGSLTFGKDWGKHLTTALTFSLEKKDQFSVEDHSSTVETDEDARTIFVTTPYVRYDTRDDFVRPKKGLLSSLSVDLSKGVQNQLDDFIRYQFDTRYYLTPIERLTFASLARFGKVASYSDTGIVPDDQLFFLGGIQDVRGYSENLLRFNEDGDPLGGQLAMVGSLEARIDLGYNFELTAFFDTGTVRETQEDFGSDSWRSSVGLGLRYITPIGPIGLLYGYKLDREEDESAGRLHVSIGYSF